jgi:hypothetical protein
MSDTEAPDLDAADVDIEEWNAARPDFVPDVVEDDPDPADVRDTLGDAPEEQTDDGR